jgi:hypothetical protein
MAVYVDELIAWPQPAKPGAERFFGNGKESCHLLTDGDMEELHHFAERLGLQRAWFQQEIDPYLGHYDLTPTLRAIAVEMGAVSMNGIDLIQLLENVSLSRTTDIR